MSIEDKIQTIKERGYAPLFFDTDYLNTFDALYFDTFGERFCLTCRGKVIGAYNRLKNYYEMADVNCEYKLKGNLQIFPAGEVITNNNLTNEVAERYLKSGSARISNFEKYPDDWESRVFGEVEKKEVQDANALTVEDLSEMKLSELRQIYPEIKARSKKEFLAELAESQA